mmetsp:Transcript_2076/g.4236  ORF Transcript_2076/g.4236 Transcript_2076/m.4236 type:complete len:225 (+) Transcript_2076:110-784(+)
MLNQSGRLAPQFSFDSVQRLYLLLLRETPIVRRGNPHPGRYPRLWWWFQARQRSIQRIPQLGTRTASARDRSAATQKVCHRWRTRRSQGGEAGPPMYSSWPTVPFPKTKQKKSCQRLRQTQPPVTRRREPRGNSCPTPPQHSHHHHHYRLGRLRSFQRWWFQGHSLVQLLLQCRFHPSLYCLLPLSPFCLPESHKRVLAELLLRLEFLRPFFDCAGVLSGQQEG